MDDRTLTPVPRKRRTSAPGDELVPALALLWSQVEPERVGEVVLVGLSGTPEVLGRGAPQEGDPAPRSHFSRQRPGRTEGAGYPMDPWLSRVALRLAAEGETLHVENAGRLPLRLNGESFSRGTLVPGDLLEIEGHYLFLVTVRPLQLPSAGLLDTWPSEGFGRADEVGLVGESPAAWAVREQIQRAALADQHTLVLGPSGTGKELVARALHQRSRRRSRALVACNAASIPESLLDAELFGNQRGFPNPGMPERAGLIGAADGSTLFLDEVGEMPEVLQAHLLRVLDGGGEYRRLGDSTSRRADFLLVAATNRPVERLKHDFVARFHRRIHVPPLEERLEDVPLIAAHLLRARSHRPAVAALLDPHGRPRLTVRLVSTLVSHARLGGDQATHVRDLGRLLELALDLTRGESLDLPAGVVPLVSAAPVAPRRGARGEAEVVLTPVPVTATRRPPRRAGLPYLSAVDMRRLELLRLHGFRRAEAASDPDYSVSRQTATVHLRVLVAKAIAAHGWDTSAALDELAADVPGGRGALERVWRDLGGWLREGGADPEAWARRQARIYKEYRPDHAAIEALAEAIRAGRITV